jgi:hypothetical protein
LCRGDGATTTRYLTRAQSGVAVRVSGVVEQQYYSTNRNGKIDETSRLWTPAVFDDDSGEVLDTQTRRGVAGYSNESNRDRQTVCQACSRRRWCRESGVTSADDDDDDDEVLNATMSTGPGRRGDSRGVAGYSNESNRDRQTVCQACSRRRRCRGSGATGADDDVLEVHGATGAERGGWGTATSPAKIGRRRVRPSRVGGCAGRVGRRGGRGLVRE